MTSGLAACCSVQSCDVHDPRSHLGQTVTQAALWRRRHKPFLWPSHLPVLHMVHSSQNIHALGVSVFTVALHCAGKVAKMCVIFGRSISVSCGPAKCRTEC